MNLSLFIAHRIHFREGKLDRLATRPAVRIATAGIAIGLTVMILAVSIVIGFKREVRNKIIGFSSHILVTNFDSNSSYETAPIYPSDLLINELRSIEGIRHVERYATTMGMIKTDSAYQGIVLKGVDSDFDWSFFSTYLVEGETLTFPSDGISSDVLISSYLSRLLNLHHGDTFLSFFIQDTETIRARKFRISGIYSTGYEEYDRLFVIGDLRQVARLNDWEADGVSGLEIFINDYEQLDALSEVLYFRLIDQKDRKGNTLYARSIAELNPMIFNWLEVLDINVVVILILMMLVSGFTMIAGLLILILERTQMIGILKSLGEDNRSIRKIFLYVSLFLTLRGMLWGNIIGVGICFLQKYFHIFTLDPSNYYLDTVPIALSVTTWLSINLCTCIVSMSMMLIPSYLITKINPSKTIRFE
jgi:lipoprotein-releasing system permease protein